MFMNKKIFLVAILSLLIDLYYLDSLTYQFHIDFPFFLNIKKTQKSQLQIFE